MFTKKELRMAYALAVCLLVVGVASYAAFTPEAPEQPLRLMFKVTAGKVLFDHKTHTSEFGYGLSCVDCHHELEVKMPNPALSVMIQMKAMKRFRSEGMPFTCSVPAVTRNMNPDRLNKNVQNVMSCKPKNQVSAGVSRRVLYPAGL
jgi:hypothetical protein